LRLNKNRGIDRWSGYETVDKKTIRGYATLTPSGQYEVQYTIDNGYGSGLKGTFVCAKLKDAESKLDTLLKYSIHTIHYKTIPVKDEITDCYDGDGDIFCPNCMNYYWITVGNGVKECTTCGCHYDPNNATVFYDQWNHEIFDKYREDAEKGRERIFSKRGWTTAEGGYRYTPENFDSGHYNKLMNYDDPKDRKRILSFNRRGFRLFGRK